MPDLPGPQPASLWSGPHEVLGFTAWPACSLLMPSCRDKSLTGLSLGPPGVSPFSPSLPGADAILPGADAILQVRLAIAHALAQSVKLSLYEERVWDLVEETRDLPGERLEQGVQGCHRAVDVHERMGAVIGMTAFVGPVESVRPAVLLRCWGSHLMGRPSHGAGMQTSL